MAITKIDANSFDLTDDYAFTGTITGDTGGSYELLNTVDVTSATANVEFDNTYITSSYTDYKVMFSRVKPSTDVVKFEMHIQKVGAASYLTGNHHYIFDGRDAGGSARTSTDTLASKFLIVATNIGNGVGETVSGEVVLIDPLKSYSSVQNFTYYGIIQAIKDTGNSTGAHIAGKYATENNIGIDTIKFQMSSGNIASGVFQLYGRSSS